MAPGTNEFIPFALSSYPEFTFTPGLRRVAISVMRRCIELFVVVAAVFLAAGNLFAAEFKLTNGDILKGEIASANDTGLIVRLDVGGFSPRVGWGKFTQETLRELAQTPQAKKYVDPFIEVPVEVKKEKEKAKKKEIIIREPPKVPLFEGKPSLAAGFFTPVGLMLLLALYAANLYAGFEVAHFRARPVPMVVGASAVLPVIGPLIFLAMPSAERVVSEEPPAEAPAPVQAENKAAAGTPGIGLAAHQSASAAAANPAYAQVYNRSNTTFDRRFFETKFTGFFRVSPAENEKDLVLVVKGAKHEYIAKRITRISMTEMHVALLRGGSEASISFGEMVEVSVRHKDAKA